MQPNFKKIREQKHLTQSELAEKSGLSLRTIQRIEAGNTPKGFTLLVRWKLKQNLRLQSRKLQT
jgi:transcriptional regulator with XRE-family HTH domain